MVVKAILACDSEGGIGKNGGLPWPHSSEDMKWFRENTEGGIVVMGRKTWESIGCRPLPRRKNIIITNTRVHGDYDAVYHGEMQRVLQTIQSDHPSVDVWIIGGGEIYRQALPFCDEVYLTRFYEKYDCDTFVDPMLMKPFQKLIRDQKGEGCSFSVWSKL